MAGSSSRTVFSGAPPPAPRLLPVLGLLLAALAGLAAAQQVAPADADAFSRPYYLAVAARAQTARRAGQSFAAAAARETFSVRTAGDPREALKGLEALGCDVLGTVANLADQFAVECPAGMLQRRDGAAPAGIAEMELQVPEQRLFRRRPVPEKDQSRFDALSDEWKEHLRGRIEEMERDAAPVPAERLAKRTVLSSAQVQDAWTTLGISDPGIRRQWHIYNNNTPAADINVTSAWVSGITGTDSIVCIIDDGLDSTNPDLKDNFYVEGSWDFNTPSQAPLPQPQSAEDNHGTRCAGEVAAVRNDVCGVGVAYDARVSGVRILSGPLTNADEAAATNYEYQKNQIYSCSWGPPDDGESLDRPTSLSQRSYIEAVTNGRGGKGNIYVFAAGNGGEKFDHCNFDGFVNQIYTIAIASVDYMNRHPSYSEACTAVHAVAPSSPSPQSGPSIYTSDAMPSQCTGQHTGTSASAPLVAGIMALALQANPDLTWRDAQYLIAETSVPVNTADGSWDTLASGKRYSPKYGFGRVDAFAMVDTARNWKNVPAQTSIPYIGQQVGKRIPHGATGVSETITITPGAVAAARLGTVEHVLVYVTVTHPTRGQLSYEIVSPSGIRSIIGEARPYDVSSQGLSNWTFMSLKYWGDQAAGDWTFTIRDEIDESRTGELVSWGLKIYGAQGEGVVSSASTRTAATSSGSLSRTTTKRGTVIVTSVSSSAAATTKSTTRSTTRSRTTTTTTTTEASLTPTLAETSTTTSRTTRTINVTSPIVPTTASPSPTSNRPSSSSGSRAGVGGVLLAAGAAALALGL